ncbi:EAL domain-containing protein [bacterium AH-315-E09]|nr:EAL domain-containing protein [bacterium AH-315-E09]
MPPNRFIAIAEETGQIIEIGEWVIKTALIQCIEWETKGINHIKMHINLSVKQLHHQNLFSFLKKTIDDLGLNAKCIVLEITESVATNSLDEAIIEIEKLKSLGVSVALDDFGTGYSSLSYTSKLPFDELKIDKSFIDKILNYEADYYISKFIIELCNARNILTTAEGVENAQQKDVLEKLGCNNIQGYYFSKPLSPKDFEDYLNKN